MTDISKNRRFRGRSKPATVTSTTRETATPPASTDDASLSRRRSMKVQTDVKAGGGLLGLFVDIDIDINLRLGGGGCKPSKPHPPRC